MNVLVLEEKSKRLLNKTSGGGKIAKWIATVVNLEDDTLLTISSFDERKIRQLVCGNTYKLFQLNDDPRYKVQMDSRTRVSDK